VCWRKSRRECARRETVGVIVYISPRDVIAAAIGRRKSKAVPVADVLAAPFAPEPNPDAPRRQRVAAFPTLETAR